MLWRDALSWLRRIFLASCLLAVAPLVVHLGLHVRREARRWCRRDVVLLPLFWAQCRWLAVWETCLRVMVCVCDSLFPALF